MENVEIKIELLKLANSMPADQHWSATKIEGKEIIRARTAEDLVKAAETMFQFVTREEKIIGR